MVRCRTIGMHSMVGTRRRSFKCEDTTNMADNSSSLSLLTVLKPGGSSHIGAESKPAKTIDQMIALMSERGW